MHLQSQNGVNDRQAGRSNTDIPAKIRGRWVANAPQKIKRAEQEGSGEERKRNVSGGEAEPSDR